MKSDGATSGQKDPSLAPPERQPHTLTDAELLGLVLAGGRVCRSTGRLARELLGEWGGLAALPGTSRAMLRHRGMSEAQASALLAACELACRLARRRIPPRRPLSRPDLVAHFLALRYQLRDQEVMGALFLDRHHGLLGETEIFRGTLHRVAVEPRQLLRQCLLRGAAGVVVFHTHPSGDPTPRLEDLAFTRRLAAAAALVGVDLVDHLVLGAGGHWVSLWARGGW
jgi:DNA repair protein RadC